MGHLGRTSRERSMASIRSACAGVKVPSFDDVLWPSHADASGSTSISSRHRRHLAFPSSAIRHAVDHGIVMDHQLAVRDVRTSISTSAALASAAD
jgi:hypothetical protein